jgi:hypothetical protein
MIKDKPGFYIFILIITFYVFNQFFIELFPSLQIEIRIIRSIFDFSLIVLVLFFIRKDSNKYFKKIIFFFIIISTITYLINSYKVEIITHLNGIREPMILFSSIFLFNYFLSREENKYYLEKMNKFIYSLALVQIPITIFQFNKFGAGDSVGGSFSDGGSGALTIFLIIVAGYYLYQKKYLYLNEIKFIDLVKSIIFIIPTFLNETKITFFLLPLVYIVILFDKKKIYKFILASLILVLLLYSFLNIYEKIEKQDKSFQGIRLQDVFDEDFIYYYFFGGNIYANEVPRLLKVVASYEKLSQNEVNLLFGVGYGIFKGQNVLGINEQGVVFNYLYYGSRTLYDAIFVQGGLSVIILLLAALFINLFRIGNKKFSRNNKFSIVLTFIIITTTIYHDAILVYYYSVLISFFLAFSYNHDLLVELYNRRELNSI